MLDHKLPTKQEAVHYLPFIHVLTCGSASGSDGMGKGGGGGGGMSYM